MTDLELQVEFADARTALHTLRLIINILEMDHSYDMGGKSWCVKMIQQCESQAQRQLKRMDRARAKLV